MERRELIALFSTIAMVLPMLGRAQQSASMRRVGALFGTGRNPVQQGYLNAFRQTLRDLGWVEGRNVLIEERWGNGDLERIQALAAELLSLKPGVIFTSGIRALNEQRRQDQAVPIVFMATTDPVAHGFARSLSQPGGNTTGFLLFDTKSLRA